MEALIYVGAFVFEYFSRTRMGMARYVIYMNGKIEKAVDVNLLKYFALALLVILLIVNIRKWLANRNVFEKSCNAIFILSLISIFIYGLFLFKYDAGIKRTYLFMLLFYFVASILNNTACLILSKNK